MYPVQTSESKDPGTGSNNDLRSISGDVVGVAYIAFYGSSNEPGQGDG